MSIVSLWILGSSTSLVTASPQQTSNITLTNIVSLWILGSSTSLVLRLHNKLQILLVTKPDFLIKIKSNFDTNSFQKFHFFPQIFKKFPFFPSNFQKFFIFSHFFPIFSQNFSGFSIRRGNTRTWESHGFPGIGHPAHVLRGFCIQQSETNCQNEIPCQNSR